MSELKCKKFECLECKKSFQKIDYLGTVKYCSRLCGNIAKAKNRNKKATVKCKECRKPFLAQEGRLKSGKGKFCSTGCFRTYQNKKVQLQCKNCDKLYKRSPSISKVSRFCCRRCCTIYTLKSMPNKETSIEIKIRKFLDESKIPYKAQVGIGNITVADFVSGKNVFMADGDYWHNLPRRQYRDKKINDKLTKLGYSVHRFWEHDIHNNFDQVKERIMHASCQ
jgi:very-short-patch-repair endonuclease